MYNNKKKIKFFCFCFTNLAKCTYFYIQVMKKKNMQEKKQQGKKKKRKMIQL